MTDRIEAHGKRADLVLVPGCLTIAFRRVGGAGAGHHRIPLAQVTGIRWRPASALLAGFIEFTVPGTASDTAVTFTRAQQDAFETLKQAAEQAIHLPTDAGAA